LLDEKKAARAAEDFLKSLLGSTALEEDQHLQRTPERVAKAWCRELLSGYLIEDPQEILFPIFQEDCAGELVMQVDIDFVSVCAHHLLPFFGVAHVGYVSRGGRVVGLSKMSRLVECYAKRLQVQEGLCRQIGITLQNSTLAPSGVGVLIEARHLCVACRGVKKLRSRMVTSCLLGDLSKDTALRDQFFRACLHGGRDDR